MKIVYQGQIGVIAGFREESIPVDPVCSVADVVKGIAMNKPEDVQRFLVDGEGEVRQSLFAALDGEHVQNYSAQVGDAKELLLMPPMAGG